MGSNEGGNAGMIQLAEQLELFVELVNVIGSGQDGFLDGDPLAIQDGLVHDALGPSSDGREERVGRRRKVERYGLAGAATSDARVGLHYLYTHLSLSLSLPLSVRKEEEEARMGGSSSSVLCVWSFKNRFV